MIATNTSFTGLKTSVITTSPSQSTAGTDVTNVEPIKQTIEAYTSWMTESANPKAPWTMSGGCLRQSCSMSWVAMSPRT